MIIFLRLTLLSVRDNSDAFCIEYNSLNLLRNVAEREGNGSAAYRWLLDGTKSGVKSGDGATGFEYLGSLVYKRENGVLSLESAGFSEGRIYKTASGYATNYFLTDHLGSTRVVFDHLGTIVETNDFEPFGNRIDNPGSAMTSNRYRFSGKEEQTTGPESGLLDFGARMYNPTLGRWMGIDPLAEKYFGSSPYTYCGNSPIRFFDPDGRKWVDGKGRAMWTNGKWTQHATRDAMRVGIAMRATKTGRAVFDRVAASSANIQVQISPKTVVSEDENGGKSLTFGQLEENIRGYSDGSTKLISGTMTIFEGSIKASLEGEISTSGDETTDLTAELPADIAIDGAIGSVGVHEGVHATSQENIRMRYDNSENKGKHDVEKEPTEEQNKYLRELLDK